MPLTVVGSPPLAASMLTPMLESETSPLTTLVLSLNFIPCLARIRCIVLAISASMPGPPMAPKYSTTVTSAPNRDQTEP